MNFKNIHDITLLPVLDMKSIMEALQERFIQHKLIYTRINQILIAINPYSTSSNINYNMETFSYSKTVPHIYNIAYEALRDVFLKDRKTLDYKSQCIICCGESGSGKTESMKYILKYIEHKNTYEKRGNTSTSILDKNTIIEYLGNAHTRRNHNSSRFTKKIDISLTEQRQIASIQFHTFLLEKSRISFIPDDEYNYHVFYVIAPHLKLPLPPTQYKLLYRNANQPLKHVEYKASLFETILGTKLHIRLQNIIHGLILLGNVDFISDPQDSEYVILADERDINQIETLLDTSLLKQQLLNQTIQIKTQTIQKRKTLNQAVLARDALIQTIYVQLFDQVIHHLNHNNQNNTSASKTISILDIFGFESFTINSFEQLCINFANEKLQYLFNERVILSEQLEYEKEGILWTPIHIINNDQVCHIFEQPQGIIHQLDSACIMSILPEQFVQNLYTLYNNHTHFYRPKPNKYSESKHCFGIRHYAQDVTYDASQFIIKNTISKQKTTIFRQFSQQMGQVMQDLSKMNLFFIRCINPNPNQTPFDFQYKYVEYQVLVGGLYNASQMIRQGYSYRIPYTDVISLLGQIQYKADDNITQLRNICQAILAFFKIDARVQFGFTRMFIQVQNDSENIWENIIKQSQQNAPALCAYITRFLIRKKWQRIRGFIKLFIIIQRYRKQYWIYTKWHKLVRLYKRVYQIQCKARKYKKNPNIQNNHTEEIHEPLQTITLPTLSSGLETKVQFYQQNISQLQAQLDQLRFDSEVQNQEKSELMAKYQSTCHVLEEKYKTSVHEWEAEKQHFLYQEQQYLAEIRDMAAQHEVMQYKKSLLEKEIQDQKITCQDYQHQIQSSTSVFKQHAQIVNTYRKKIQEHENTITYLHQHYSQIIHRLQNQFKKHYLLPHQITLVQPRTSESESVEYIDHIGNIEPHSPTPSISGISTMSSGPGP